MKKFIAFIVGSLMLVSAFAQTELEGSYLDYNDMSSAWVSSILEETIFDVFTKDLKSYDTDLKKEVFLNSPDSKKYRDNLEKIRNHLKIDGITYNLRSNVDEVSIANYNTKTKSFRVCFGSNMSLSGTSGIGIKNVLAGFYAPQVPISTNINEIIKEMTGSSEFVTYDYDWKVDDINKALEIEDNLKDVNIRLKVVISGMVKVSGKGYANRSWYNISRNRPAVKSIVIEFYNKKTNEIYGSVKY